MKAGGAYLPVDLNSPQDRIGYLLESTAVTLMITSSTSNCPWLSREQVVYLDQEKAIINHTLPTKLEGVTPDSLSVCDIYFWVHWSA